MAYFDLAGFKLQKLLDLADLIGIDYQSIIQLALKQSAGGKKITNGRGNGMRWRTETTQ